jgi:ABC-type transport system substrate-binding protein
MKQQDVQIMADLMYDQIVVLPKEAEKDGTFGEPSTYNGSGPFQVEYGEVGGSWKLVKNPTYWEKDKAGKQLPYLDGMVIVTFGDNAGRIAAFKSRQVDMVPIQYSSGRALLGIPDVRYSYQRGLVNGGIGVYLNTKIAPFSDVKMRHAVNLALDRDEWINIVQGGHDAGFVVGSLGAWEPWSWSEAKMWSLPGYAKGEAKEKEIEQAKQMIKDAGYANGVDVIYNGQSVLENEVIQDQMRRVGIRTKEIPYGAGKYTSTTIETGRQIAYSYQGGGHVPDAAIVASFLCDGTQNVALYCNPKLDALFAEWRTERESDKRMKILNDLQQILWDDMPMAPGVRHNTIHAGYKFVRGYRNSWYDLRWSQGFQMAYVWMDK